MIVHKHDGWLRLLLAVRGTALSQIWPRMTVTVLIAAAVSAIYHVRPFREFSLTTVPFTLVGVALAVFLGFRNNTSYARYWEGNALMTRMINASRSLSRQILTLIGPAEGAQPDDEEAAEQRSSRDRLVRRVIAFNHALRGYLRGEDLHQEIQAHLPPAEAAALRAERNRPLAVLTALGQDLAAARERGWVRSSHVPVMERELAELTAVLGGCERLQANPIPFPYRVLLHRIVAAYYTTLAFGLVDSIGVMTPLVVAIISYAFYGMDAIGEEVQEPFGTDANDLPLAAIGRSLEIELRAMLGDRDLPAPLEPKDSLLS